MSNKIKVKKRDGSLEDFNQMKIAIVVTAAGLTHEEGQQLAVKITDWARIYSNPAITSLQIRDKVIEELQKLNPNAADLYTWYEKTKDEPVKINEEEKIV
ncbi:ATP cone domain-containing protein [Patescibacteria group bacterium]|nr:ATP cone domain-containing protein [Patescibacteria group bacterium]